MSRKHENERGRFAEKRRRRRRAWIIAGASVAAFLGVAAAVLTGGGAAASHHPEPRLEAGRSTVVPSARYATLPRVAQTYELAAAVPHVLDGLHCYCECQEHSGHYSLLDCFASDHAARCDICLSEAVIGHQMDRDGASLDAIRSAIDRTFGT